MNKRIESLSFQTLFDAAVDAMLLTDDTGRVIGANPAALALLAYTEEAIIGLPVEALMPAKFRERHHHYRDAFNKNSERRAMGGGKSLAALSASGEELAVDIGLSPIHSPAGNFTLITLHAAEEHYKAARALEVSEEQLHLAKKIGSLGVFDFDANHNITQWDEPMRELWGAESEKSVVYKKFLTAIHPDDRVIRQEALDRAIDPAGSGDYHAEYRVINPNSKVERWVLVLGKMHFENGSATRLVGVAKDITESKALEKKLQSNRAENESILKQQVASRTASAIAHELNQPLAAISAYSEVALRALDDANPEQLKRALEGCVAQAQRAGTSLHELMAFLQEGELITERMNINEAVQEAIDITKGDGYQEFHPLLQLEKNIPDVLGNKTHVQKVLMNLLRNGVEAMRSAGMPASAIMVTVRTNQGLNMAHVTVQDSGPGLTPETAKRIFEPFFTTKPTGIGMGLAICRALVEANGGQLWLEPSSKTGAIFHFTLPFAP